MRVAYMLTIKPGKEAAYRETHDSVWPERIAEARKVGIRNHSTFVQG